MFTILLFIGLIAAIFFLYVFIATSFALSRDNELPDIEDIELNEQIRCKS